MHQAQTSQQIDAKPSLIPPRTLQQRENAWKFHGFLLEPQNECIRVCACDFRPEFD